MSWQWEYHREVIQDAEWVARCSELGRDGWRCRWMERQGAAEHWDCRFERAVTTRALFRRALNRPLSPAAIAELEAFGERVQADRAARLAAPTVRG